MSEQPETDGISMAGTEIDTTPSLLDTNIEDTSAETLTELNYRESIQNIANIDSQLDNLSDATAYVQRVQSAIKNLKSKCDIDSLQELDERIESKYIRIGEILIKKIDDEEVLFKTSDEPESLVTDIEFYFDALEREYERQSALTRARNELAECRAKLEGHPGTNINDAIEAYENQSEKLNTADHFLQLQDGECINCGVKWENISKNRRDEIEQKLIELEAEFESDCEEFDEEFVHDTKSSIDSNLKELEELRENIRQLKDNIKHYEQQDTDTLDRLYTTHVED